MRDAPGRIGLSRRSAMAGAGGFAALGFVMSSIRVTAQDATPAGCADIEANKDLIRRFYAAFYEAAHTGNPDLIDEFVATDYEQHEQGLGQGREGLKALLRQMAGRPSAEPPPLAHLIAEGDIVIAHQVVPGSDSASAPIAEGVDIFRIADGQLVEHWGIDAEYDQPEGTPASGTPTA